MIESPSNTCGWGTSLPVFQGASLDEVVNSLVEFVRDSTPEQIRAWRASVPAMQRSCEEILNAEPKAVQYGAILEYVMPDGPHRADAILLVSGAVLVLELKGDGNWQPEYIEQAADYARRLFWWHRLCGEENVRVHTILVSYGRKGDEVFEEWHTRTNIEKLNDVVRRFDRPKEAEPISVEAFIAPQSCQPSPSLVQAARQFFSKNALPHIKRIDAVTSPAVEQIVNEIRRAHAEKKRLLVLLSGVPGAGKTYVGLKIAHESFLDDLAEPMADGAKPTAPAIFLSGNGPLVEVLQYELKRAGGGGKVFVRGVKEFVKKYTSKRSPVPPHHVLIFDEAQRAWDADKVRSKHTDGQTMSEPEAFIQFAERIPSWSVVIGLIGEGQEIHTGEEAGIGQWADAVNTGTGWEVVGPKQFADRFAAKGVGYQSYDALHLAKSVRFNFAAGLSDWATGIVAGTPAAELAPIAATLIKQGYQLRVTRNLARAKDFLWAKYRNVPDARFGLLKSSRDRDLAVYGVEENRFFHPGPWYAEPENSPASCRRLQEPATEFAAQGLELDHVLLAWGGDFIRKNGIWTNAEAKRYKDKTVKDPLQLRRNAYRVLLTRGREGIAICLPSGLTQLDETFRYLVESGCDVLE